MDVREGCNIDYKGNHVNVDNFLAVLKGDASAVQGSNKVLKSNENSNVFIYYADHGAPGLVAMPRGRYLYSD